MSNIKKLMMSAAGGGALNVEDVFSTYLYHSNDTSPQQIVNGIDLAGEGGLVWIANRENGGGLVAFDSERPSNDPFDERLWLYGTQSSYSDSELQITPNSDGFTRTSRSAAIGGQDYDYDYASWTFRKAPKFFDVVTYTGNGTDNRVIPHNLGSAPGFMVVKRTDSSSNWFSYHRLIDFGENNVPIIYLNSNAARSYTGMAFQTQVGISNSNNPALNFIVRTPANTNGATYVVYIFAHNNGDGEFGPDGDQDIIKCGSYTGNGSNGNNGTVVDLGFEPQWLMVRNANGSGDWVIVDTMRGFPGTYEFGNQYAEMLHANGTIVEDPEEWFKVLPNGFQLTDSATNINSSGSNYIYMAIRRGTKVPESATEVFDISYGTATEPWFDTDFPVDMALWGAPGSTTSSSKNRAMTRLQGGNYLLTHSTEVESALTSSNSWDYMDGFYQNSGTNTSWLAWMWKRAPGFFDVVAYSGNSTAGRTVSHNLGVAPEMMWLKSRTNTTFWPVYHKDVGYSSVLRLDSSTSPITIGMVTNTSDTDFTLSTSSAVNSSGHNFIAYLFASLDGISKVGSYTGNGSSQTIDCGFSSGARFVLVKRADATGNWMVMDTARGIVTGDEGVLFLDLTIAESTGDWIDPASSGFIINDVGTGFNENGSTYIFYAIA